MTVASNWNKKDKVIESRAQYQADNHDHAASQGISSISDQHFCSQVLFVPVPYDVDGAKSLYFGKLNNALTNNAGSTVLDNSIT